MNEERKTKKKNDDEAGRWKIRVIPATGTRLIKTSLCQETCEMYFFNYFQIPFYQYLFCSEKANLSTL